MKIGFVHSTSQAKVHEAVLMFRKFEQLVMSLTPEERAQVYEKTPVHDMTEWGAWE